MVENGRPADLRERHAEFFERLAHEGEVALRTTAQQQWLETLTVEQPNIRSAIQWSLDHGAEARALRTATSLYRFWGKSSGAEGRMWLDRALATGTGTPAERATASFAAGQLELLHGQMGRAVELLETAVLLARKTADITVLALSLGYCGWANYEHGEHERSAVLHAECRALLPEVHDPAITAEVLTALGAAAGNLGDLQTAERLFLDVLEIERRLGDELGIADALNNLGWVAWAAGRPAEARGYLEECLAIAQGHGDDIRATLAIGNLGLTALSEERWEDAVELHLEELRSSNRRGNQRGALEALLGLAVAYSRLNDLQTAVELYGAFEGVCDATGYDPATGWLNTLTAPFLERTRSELDAATIEELTARGHSQTPEQMLKRLESRGNREELEPSNLGRVS